MYALFISDFLNPSFPGHSDPRHESPSVTIPACEAARAGEGGEEGTHGQTRPGERVASTGTLSGQRRAQQTAGAATGVKSEKSWALVRVVTSEQSQ